MPLSEVPRNGSSQTAPVAVHQFQRDEHRHECGVVQGVQAIGPTQGGQPEYPAHAAVLAQYRASAQPEIPDQERVVPEPGEVPDPVELAGTLALTPHDPLHVSIGTEPTDFPRAEIRHDHRAIRQPKRIGQAIELEGRPPVAAEVEQRDRIHLPLLSGLPPRGHGLDDRDAGAVPHGHGRGCTPIGAPGDQSDAQEVERPAHGVISGS
jgi:hypothetical protein